MTEETGKILLEEIAPRLKGAVAHIKPVGCEDREELLQDGLAMAAHLLEANERQGKQVPPCSVAYYVALHLRSGRRSYSAGRTDAYSSATQLDGKSCVMSLDAEVGYDPETMEPIHLGDMLMGSHEDPAMAAGRNLDWQEFVDSHDYRYGVIIKDHAEGKNMRDGAKDIRMGYSSAMALKYKMASELKEFLGPDALADACRVPMWKASMH